MIENFEERYADLLKDIDDDSFVMLPSIESRGGYLCQPQAVIASKESIDHVKGAFIEKYCM